MIVLLGGEDRHLLSRLDITKRELHCKPIHLRLGQWVRAAELDRILSGDHEKKAVQVTTLAIHAHLTFAHRLEQCRLRAWGGAVDLIGQQDVREDWTLMKVELLVQSSRTSCWPMRSTAPPHARNRHCS